LKQLEAAVEYRVEDLRPHKNFFVLKLEGVETMTQAEALAGAEVLVPEEELQPLKADTFYHHQIMGCRVVTVDGREVGRVADIQSAAGNDLLVIRPEGREEILIPFSRDICREVDLEAGLIVIDPPDGLLDLNEI